MTHSLYNVALMQNTHQLVSQKLPPFSSKNQSQCGNIEGGFGMRKMLTFSEKKLDISNRLKIPLQRKNSNKSKASSASRRRESSRRAKERKHSRYGRSQMSYLTFGPQQQAQKRIEEYNLKMNQVDDDQISRQLKKTAWVSKKVYSKKDYKAFPSLKSVLKPRSICLIKESREAEKFNFEQDSAD